MRSCGILAAVGGPRWLLVVVILFWFTIAEYSFGGPPESMPADRVFEKASPAVVSVVVTGEGGLVKRGTGFLVSDDGLIATNYHVIKDGRSAEVILPTLAKLAVKGVVASNPDWDLAILRVEGKSLPFLKIAKDDPKIGAKVYAIGNPKGLTNTLSDGLVSGVREISNDLSLLQTTAAISPGSSGGPLLAESGEVVGITTSSLVTGQNLNFAVPGKRLFSLLSKVGEPIPLSKASLSATSSAPADGDIIDSFRTVVLRTPRSILPLEETPSGPSLKLTKLGINLFNVRASEALVGKRLLLPVTHEDNFRLQILPINPGGTVRMNFEDWSKPFGVPRIIYEIEARMNAEQATVLADLPRTGVKIGGRITQYRLGANSSYKVDLDETPLVLGKEIATVLVLSIELEDVSVERCIEPTSTPVVGVREPLQEPKPTTKPTPRVLPLEEQALARAALAKSYLDAGIKEKAIDLLRSVIADFPQTEAAVQAKKEIERLTPTPSKKE